MEAIGMQQQGAQANANGRMLEQDIAHRLISHGYCEVPAYGRERYFHPQPFTVPFFVRCTRGLQDQPFQSIYDLEWRVDFYVWHAVKHPSGLIIEAKYQQGGGSVDEKYPFILGSLQRQQAETMVLFLGQGMRRESIAWCRRNCPPRCLIMTWEEFVLYANKGRL
jgi:hypothetical protein